MNYLTQTNGVRDDVKCVALVEQIRNFIRAHADVVVIGMSGGIDSTVLTVLSMKALGKGSVIGLHLPAVSSDVDGDKFNARSVKTATYLDIVNQSIQIGDACTSIISQIGTVVSNKNGINKLTEGNTRARLRMTALYAVAYELGILNVGKRVRVLNSCQISETLVGFETRFGDGAGDLSPLASLLKQEVYDLADHFVFTGSLREEDIDRVPSPGLYEGHTDEDELGYSYNQMAPASLAIVRGRGYAALEGKTVEDLKGYIEDAGVAYDECAKTVADKCLKNLFKSLPMPSLNLDSRLG